MSSQSEVIETTGSKVADELVRRGLDPEDRDRAFERFWRAGSDRPGSGLGLSIVRATAERHGGRVTAFERPGQLDHSLVGDIGQQQAAG